MAPGASQPWPEAVPSATVVLARDGDSGVEVLLVLRHENTAFGASYVFPGGLIEPSDALPPSRYAGLDERGADRALGLEQGGIAYFSAAIRELFEEAGVLLATTPDGHWADGAAYADERRALNDGDLDWRRFLERHDLTLAADALHYFAYWVTPRELRRRYSTRFFVAELPAEQEAMHCGGELVDSRWLTVGRALAAAGDGDIVVPPPTEATLRDLAGFETVAAMLEWAEGCCEDGVACCLPAILRDGGKQEVVMPGDPRYPDYGDGEGA